MRARMLQQFFDTNEILEIALGKDHTVALARPKVAAEAVAE